MDARWFKYCKNEDQKKEIKAYFGAAGYLLDTLAKILEEELNSSIKESSNKESYKLPAWSEYQADRLGEQRTLRKILNIIKPDKGLEKN